MMFGKDRQILYHSDCMCVWLRIADVRYRCLAEGQLLMDSFDRENIAMSI